MPTIKRRTHEMKGAEVGAKGFKTTFRAEIERGDVVPREDGSVMVYNRLGAFSASAGSWVVRGEDLQLAVLSAEDFARDFEVVPDQPPAPPPQGAA